MKKLWIVIFFTLLIQAENNTTTINKNKSNAYSYTKSLDSHKKKLDDSKTIELKQNGTTFYIQKLQLAKYYTLIKMILVTESMDDDERQYWFDIMPSMTDKQIDRLYKILDTERKKLQALEIKYQKEIKALNEKHLIEWREFQVKAKQRKELNSTSTDYYEKMIKKINEIKAKK